MIKILGCILAIISVMDCNKIIIDEKFASFQQYVDQFRKSYSSMEQYQLREKVYYENMKKNYDLADEMGFETGPNQFTDRTVQQMRGMKNSRLKPLSRSVTPHSSINRKLGGPSSLNWVSRGKVSPVKDQGFCGSCWAFATAAYSESSLIINSGYNNSIDLSQQYLLQCTEQSDCKGGYPSYALLTVLNHGIPKQQVFPYNPFNFNKDICSTRKSIKIKGKQVFVYFSLSDFEMIYLLQTSPIIVGVSSEGWQAYTGGIMKCKPNGTQDHAVLLVGYTPEYWLVKNQWGETWGQNGYVKISRNPQHNCLMGVEVDVMFSPIFMSSVLFLMVLIFLFTN